MSGGGSPPEASRAHSEWDDFFIYNPASRHRRRILKGLIRRLGLAPREVLDVGCGDGRFLEEIQEGLGCSISGVEIGRTSAPERLKGRLKALHRLDIQESPAPGTYDLVICSEVLEHLPRHERAAAHLAAMCRGHILVTVPGALRETDKPMGHVRAYSVESLRSLLEGAGFETLECFRWGFPFHQLYRWALDLFPGAIMSDFGVERYGPGKKLACHALYALFRLSVPRLGEQLFYAGRRNPGGFRRDPP